MGWIVLILALMIPLVAVVLDSHVGRAIAEYIVRRGGAPVESGISGQRLAALESEVERLGRELQRLEEETTFLHRLLESKPSSRGELPPS